MPATNSAGATRNRPATSGISLIEKEWALRPMWRWMTFASATKKATASSHHGMVNGAVTGLADGRSGQSANVTPARTAANTQTRAAPDVAALSRAAIAFADRGFGTKRHNSYIGTSEAVASDDARDAAGPRSTVRLAGPAAHHPLGRTGPSTDGASAHPFLPIRGSSPRARAVREARRRRAASRRPKRTMPMASSASEPTSSGIRGLHERLVAAAVAEGDVGSRPRSRRRRRRSGVGVGRLRRTPFSEPYSGAPVAEVWRAGSIGNAARRPWGRRPPGRPAGPALGAAQVPGGVPTRARGRRPARRRGGPAGRVATSSPAMPSEVKAAAIGRVADARGAERRERGAEPAPATQACGLVGMRAGSRAARWRDSGGRGSRRRSRRGRDGARRRSAIGEEGLGAAAVGIDEVAGREAGDQEGVVERVGCRLVRMVHLAGWTSDRRRLVPSSMKFARGRVRLRSARRSRVPARASPTISSAERPTEEHQRRRARLAPARSRRVSIRPSSDDLDLVRADQSLRSVDSPGAGDCRPVCSLISASVAAASAGGGLPDGRSAELRRRRRTRASRRAAPTMPSAAMDAPSGRPKLTIARRRFRTEAAGRDRAAKPARVVGREPEVARRGDRAARLDAEAPDRSPAIRVQVATRRAPLDQRRRARVDVGVVVEPTDREAPR